MEKRMAKVNYSAAGGTACKGSKTCKITIPTAWLCQLGLSETSRQVELSFDGAQITISAKAKPLDFVTSERRRGHDLRLLRFYDGAELCSLIAADFTLQELCVENYGTDIVKTAFGKNQLPVWDDLQFFLKERCISRQRAGLREYMNAIGVDEYNTLEIIKKTSGIMAEDHQRLEIEVLK